MVSLFHVYTRKLGFWFSNIKVNDGGSFWLAVMYEFGMLWATLMGRFTPAKIFLKTNNGG